MELPALRPVLVLACVVCACHGRRTAVTNEALQSSEVKQSSTASSDLKLLASYLTGGFSKAGLLGSKDGEQDPALDVWEQVIQKSPAHEGHDLVALGKPLVVKKQVVAGYNYQFGFESGASVTVFHQPWTSTLEVSSVRDESTTNQKRLTEWSQDVEGLQAIVEARKVAKGSEQSSDVLATSSLAELKQSSSSGRSDLRGRSGTSSRNTLNKALAMFLMGGWSKVGLLGSKDGEHDEAFDIWDQVVQKSPTHEGHDLVALGRPIVMRKQVVSGHNYMFGFKNGASVVVYHQPWTGTLEISDVKNDRHENQARLDEWSKDVPELRA